MWQIEGDQNIASIKEFHEFIGKSDASCDLIKIADVLGSTNSSVVIFGEQGSGKRNFADQIFLARKKQDQAFFAIDCYNFDFSRFDTFNFPKDCQLFFDDISLLDKANFARFLTFLHEKWHENGIIASSTQKLPEIIECENSSDTICVNILPLRDRVDDILPLANFFLKKNAQKFRKKINGFSILAQKKLLFHLWQKNVDELKNVVERACIFEKNDTISENSLILGQNFTEFFGASQKSLKTACLDFKKSYVHSVLNACGKNQTRAAKILNVSRVYLSRLVKAID